MEELLEAALEGTYANEVGYLILNDVLINSDNIGNWQRIW